MPNILLFADDAFRIASRSYHGGAVEDPYDDLSSYGSGQSLNISDHRRRPNGLKNNWSGLRSQNYAFMGGVPQISFSTFRAQRGEVLPTLVDNSIGIASYPALSAVLRPAARLFLPAMGAAGGAAIASMLAVLPAYGFGKAAASSVRYFKSWGYKLRHIEQGGDYTDTETALALRMRAVGDMNSALSYSRRWLGNEALFMR